MTHIMLDLETWGTRPGCAIRSIGAVMFEPRGQGFGTQFYANIEGASCLAAGLHIEMETVQWWEGQSAKAKAHLQDNQIPLNRALDDFRQFAVAAGNPFVWGHGASFDAPILGEAYRLRGEFAPWFFWDLRDTRTLFDLAGIDLRSLPRLGTHHNALDDAKHQVLVLQAAYKKLGLANG